jgi:hypothetical protein
MGEPQNAYFLGILCNSVYVHKCEICENKYLDRLFRGLVATI